MASVESEVTGIILGCATSAVPASVGTSGALPHPASSNAATRVVVVRISAPRCRFSAGSADFRTGERARAQAQPNHLGSDRPGGYGDGAHAVLPADRTVARRRPPGPRPA